MTALSLPTFLYGHYRDVKRACRRAAAAVAKGASLVELPDGWMDVGDMPGYILIRKPFETSLDEVPHYHGYLLAAELLEALGSIGDPRWDAVFEAMLPRPWLIDCCLGQDAYFLFRDPERARRFVVAVRDQWEILNAPGRRFRTDRPEWFWRAQRTVFTSLGRLGASNEEVTRELLDPALHDGARPHILDRYAQS